MVLGRRRRSASGVLWVVVFVKPRNTVSYLKYSNCDEQARTSLPDLCEAFVSSGKIVRRPMETSPSLWISRRHGTATSTDFAAS